MPMTQVNCQPIDRFKTMNRLKNFEILGKLGQGTFGVVQKARNTTTGEIVALKQLLNHTAKEGFPITAMREITIVKQLNHDNVLRILDMIYEDPKVTNAKDVVYQRGSFYTVSSYMTSDLVGLLENPLVNLQLPQIKCLMQQLLKGIQYIHEQKFLHRDIKAANLLVDHQGILKIADFGLARTYHGKVPKLGSGPGGGERAYTGLVVTRWYRPPEILLGERKYTTAVDMWGIGCVFGEFFTKKPIMSGKTDSHQCQLVFQLVGAPKSEDWPDINNLPNKTDLNIGLTCKRSLEEKFFPLIGDNLGVDLLSKLLTLNPYKRYNALDALNHKFFSTEPFPDLPHEMPQFEECHEIDKDRLKELSKNMGSISRPISSHKHTPIAFFAMAGRMNNDFEKHTYGGRTAASTVGHYSPPRSSHYSPPRSSQSGPISDSKPVMPMKVITSRPLSAPNMASNNSSEGPANSWRVNNTHPLAIESKPGPKYESSKPEASKHEVPKPEASKTEAKTEAPKSTLVESTITKPVAPKPPMTEPAMIKPSKPMSQPPLTNPSQQGTTPGKIQVVHNPIRENIKRSIETSSAFMPKKKRGMPVFMKRPLMKKDVKVQKPESDSEISDLSDVADVSDSRMKDLGLYD